MRTGLGGEAEAPAVSLLLHCDEAVAHDHAAEGCCFIEGVGAVAAHTAARLACDALLGREGKLGLNLEEAAFAEDNP